MDVFKNQYQFLEKELQQEILQIGVPKTFQPNDVLIREGQFITRQLPKKRLK